ncbi:MAG: N-acyl-D-amino-acid deacylase family protein [Minisyncoccia bacterium]
MTILLKNGLVIDGLGNLADKKDILINNDKIAIVGDVNNSAAADTIIDAVNCFIAPGFIDINTDSDHYLTLFKDPQQEDFIKQGVTTIIGGNCGASLAPLIDGLLISIRRWGDPTGINVQWNSVEEFLKVVEKLQLGVNFGTMVGHNTIRRAITKDIIRDLTDSEITMLKKIVKNSLEQGAFGFSTNLQSLHSRPTTIYELEEILKVVSDQKKVYSVHLKDTGPNLIDAVKENIALSKKFKLKVEINHFQPLTDFKEEYEEAKNLIESEFANSFINFDCYPFNISSMPLFQLLPPWVQDGGLSEMLESLNSSYLKSRIISHLRKYSNNDLIITSLPESLSFLNGTSLYRYAENNRLEFAEALFRLMQLSHLHGTVFIKNIDNDLLKEFIFSSVSFISSNGYASTDLVKHERNIKTFSTVLKLALDNKIPLEQFIPKFTFLPAQKYNIKKRGAIKEGNYADLVIFKDNEIKYVIINGVIVVSDGQLLNKRVGRVLRSYE